MAKSSKNSQKVTKKATKAAHKGDKAKTLDKEIPVMQEKVKKTQDSEPKAEAKTEAKSHKESVQPSLLDLVSHQSIEDIGALSENLRKAALASTKITEALTLNKDGFSPEKAMNPDPLGMGPYGAEVMAKLISDPEKFAKAQSEFWSGYANIWQEAVSTMMGQAPKENEGRPDKRFADKEWSENPFFDLMKKSYLHTAGWMNSLVQNIDGVDDLTKRKASFMTEQITNAFAPSNFLLTNPVALKEMFLTKGESVSKGLSNLARDIERGKGKLSIAQSDCDAFEVGKNVAVTPGKVVYRGTLFELIHYTPTTVQVHEIPLLFFPPWINKFYIMDLRQDNSLIKWCTEQGYSVFVVSWVNPTQELAEMTFTDYIEKGIFEALAVTLDICKTEKANCIGYCIGGTLLATAMAYMAKIGDERINSATFYASQQDFMEAGDLKIFTDDAAFQYIQNEMEAAGGVLDASVMADTFNYLRSNDLVWSFVVSNYLMGKDNKPFDLLFWNSDQTRMPRNLHLFYLDNYYRKNNFAEGRLEINGEIVNLGDIKTPIYMQSSKEDHIAPYQSIYRGAKLFGGDVRMIMAGSGHIAGVINHPDANKYQHWLPKEGAKLPDDVKEWQASLSELKGSWWPDWVNWLNARSGGMIEARQPGSDAKYPALCDAPGEYVKVK